MKLLYHEERNTLSSAIYSPVTVYFGSCEINLHLEIKLKVMATLNILRKIISRMSGFGFVLLLGVTPRYQDTVFMCVGMIDLSFTCILNIQQVYAVMQVKSILEVRSIS